MENYSIICKVGEGTFGEVFKAKHVETGQTVALKKIRIRRLEEGLPKNLLREIKALEQIDHPHVVRLFEHFPQGSSIVIAFEFLESDLHQTMRSMAKAGRTFTEAEVKTIMLMMLQGVAAVHECKLMHRDLKPANILFSPEGVLKLGDFGLARVFHSNRQKADAALYTHEVATRWYRAPELLFGARNYGQEVDMWAVGCIFAELLNHSPLFPGENDIDQLYRVLKAMGTPDEKSWPEVNELPDFNKITFPHMPRTPLEQMLPDASPAALNLLNRLLAYRPKDRVSAKEALQDDYFLSEPLPAHYCDLAQLAKLPRAMKEKRASSHLSASQHVYSDLNFDDLL